MYILPVQLTHPQVSTLPTRRCLEHDDCKTLNTHTCYQPRMHIFLITETGYAICPIGFLVFAGTSLLSAVGSREATCRLIFCKHSLSSFPKCKQARMIAKHILFFYFVRSQRPEKISVTLILCITASASFAENIPRIRSQSTFFLRESVLFAL